MKKHLLLLATVALASLSGAALANPFVNPASSASASADALPITYELGVGHHRETYSETHAGAKVMQEKAPMTAINGKVSYKLNGGSTVSLGGYYAWGDATYTGSYQGGSYGDLRISDLSRTSWGLNLGYQMDTGFNDIKLNTGLGFRQLTDNLQEAGVGGYKRENTLLYASIGLERDFVVGSWTITPAATYNHLLTGKQKADLAGGLSMTQKKGYGTELSLMFAHASGFGDGKFVVGPYMRTWSIQKSEITGGFFEPKNKTKEIGVKMAYRF